MKFSIDTKSKAITIHENVNFGEIKNWLKEHIKDYKDYTIRSSCNCTRTPLYWYCYDNETQITYTTNVSSPTCALTSSDTVNLNQKH